MAWHLDCVQFIDISNIEITSKGNHKTVATFIKIYSSFYLSIYLSVICINLNRKSCLVCVCMYEEELGGGRGGWEGWELLQHPHGELPLK